MAISGILPTATSALTANTRRVEAAAANLANAETEGFRPRDVRTVSRGSERTRSGAVPGGGVDTVVLEGDGPVEPAREFANLIEARTAYRMALQTLQVGKDMDESLNFIV